MMQLPEKLTNSMRNSEAGVTLQIRQVGQKVLASYPSLAAIPAGGSQQVGSISV